MSRSSLGPRRRGRPGLREPGAARAPVSPGDRNGARAAGLGLLALACAILVPAPGGRPARAETPAGAAPGPEPRPADWPLSAVGKLNVVTGPASRQHCTATLVGPRLALTAAHCLYIRARKSWVAPGDVHFVAGYALGRYTAHAVARGYTKPEGYAYGTAPADLARDWAVIELAADIPLRPVPVLPPAGAAAPALAGIVHAGYKRGSDQVVSVERGCTARLLPGPTPLLSNSCVIVPGESGSALIGTGPDGPAIVGVLVATTGAAGKGGPAPVSLAVPAAAFRPAVEAALAGTR